MLRWFWITQPLETRAVGPLFREDGLVLVGHCGARLNRGIYGIEHETFFKCACERRRYLGGNRFAPVAERQDDETGCDRKPYAAPPDNGVCRCAVENKAVTEQGMEDRAVAVVEQTPCAAR